MAEFLEEVFGGAGEFRDIGVMCKLLSLLSNKEPDHQVLKLKEYTQSQLKKTLDATLDGIQIIQPCSIVERLSNFAKSDDHSEVMRPSGHSRILADMSVHQQIQRSSSNLVFGLESNRSSQSERPRTDYSSKQQRVLATLQRCESRLRLEMTTAFTTLKTQASLIAMQLLSSTRFSTSSDRSGMQLADQDKGVEKFGHSGNKKHSARRNSRSGGDVSKTELSRADISGIDPLENSSYSQHFKQPDSDPLSDEIAEFLRHEAETQVFLEKLALSHSNILQESMTPHPRHTDRQQKPETTKKPLHKQSSEVINTTFSNQGPRKNDKRPVIK